jgi:hypothetical protein
LSNANFHPDGFVPMNPPEQKWSDDVRALERGIAFFEELRSNGHTGVVTSGASVKPNPPLGGVQKPLSVGQIDDLWTSTASSLNPETFARFVRAVEAAHGIT